MSERELYEVDTMSPVYEHIEKALLSSNYPGIERIYEPPEDDVERLERELQTSEEDRQEAEARVEQLKDSLRVVFRDWRNKADMLDELLGEMASAINSA